RHDDDLAIDGVGFAICRQRHNVPRDLLAGRIMGGWTYIAPPRIEASFLFLVSLAGAALHEGRQDSLPSSGGIVVGSGLPQDWLGKGSIRQAHDDESMHEWLHFAAMPQPRKNTSD